MTLVELIASEAAALSPQAQQQALDFVLALKAQDQAALEADMDAVVFDNLVAWKELAK